MEKGRNGDGDESGGTSPSRQGAGTGILSPRNLFSMAAEIGIASGEKGSVIRVSSAGGKIGAKGGTERGHKAVRRAGGGGARAWGGAAPGTLLAAWWWPSCRILVIPEALGALIFYIIFPGFIGHFNYWKNLKYKNSRKQELATGCTELIG